jgi:hypothetical protein
MVYFKGKNDAIPPTTKEYIGNKKDTMLRNKRHGTSKGLVELEDAIWKEYPHWV